MRIRIFQRGKISGSRTVDHQIFSTYTFTKCQIFVLRKNSGESISYPFAFGIEGFSNSIYRRLFSFTKSHKGPERVCVEKISSRRRDILCVEKIRSRPRGILCVDKIGSVPPDRVSPGDHPVPLSKIDQWAILLRGNAGTTFAIIFFPSRFSRPGRSSCFAPHRHTRTVDH